MTQFLSWFYAYLSEVFLGEVELDEARDLPPAGLATLEWDF